MKIARRLIYSLAAALVVALAATSVALAVQAGDWKDSKRLVTISVANDGKHISGFIWQCNANDIRRGFLNNNGPKIRRRGRFAFKGKANLIQEGQTVGKITLRVKGRFRRVRGKRRAVGTIRARGCGKHRFRAKPPANPGY
jgi:hypothetical protein